MARKKKIKFDFTPSEYQEKIFDFIINGKGNAVISAYAGSGKCLGYNTEVLMYDGSIKKVQDIKIGDKLMGDDSTPRMVLSTTKGYGKLKKIIPIKGEEWVCNDVHVLTLSKYRAGWKNRKSEHITIDIPINELEKETNGRNVFHPNGNFRQYKILKTGVKFKAKKVKFDPWLYGIWLGDGTCKQANITNKDDAIINKIKEIKQPFDSVVKVMNNGKCPLISILSESHKRYTNDIRQFFRKSSNENGKFIIKDYLINSEDIRLKLLAGIIDSDGYYHCNNYYISTKWKQFNDDILFLARSLGFAAYSHKVKKTCYNTGKSNYYYSISIYGDIEKIPVVLDRKKAKKRVICKNPLHVGFKIEDNGEGDFYGFTLDGNGRFLLSDFTITHNTSTIVSAISLIPNKEKAIFIAFNKSIADELNEKLKNQSNASACTSHSLGYRMIRRNLGSNIIIDEYKYRTYVKNNIVELSGLEDGEVNIHKNQTSEYIDNITKLIDFSRLFLCTNIEEVDNIAKRYDIPIIANECEVALKCLEWGKNNTSSIDYADMLWFPTALDMQPIGMTYDWVFIDEAQDSSKATIALFKKCVKENGRWVAVGDEKQTVNLFAGSCEENFNQLCQEPNTQVFKLPISYRCGKQIVKIAQELVPDIRSKIDAVEGEVKENCHLKDLKDGDMVLARSKAPLLTIYSKLIKKGISCYIKGIDVGTNLISLLDEVKGTKLNKGLTEDGVFVQLYDRLFNERNKLVLNRGLDVDDATLSSYILEKYDIIKALEVIAYDVKTKSELKDKIRDIFREDSKGVCISTIHKSKGLEADNVYIVCHSSMPSKHCHHEWERIQENNLIYVAYTRAKKLLGFISEKEIPPSGSTSDSETILNELNNIEKIICGLLGKPTFNGTNSVEAAKARIKKIEKVELPKPKKKKTIKSVANKKDSNNKLLSDLDGLI